MSRQFSLGITLVLSTVTVASAQTFETVVNFDGQNGSHPAYGTLVQGDDGSLYGTTYDGGRTMPVRFTNLAPAVVS